VGRSSGGTFVADGESPATGAGGVAAAVAGRTRRSCAGIDNDARAGPEGCFKGCLMSPTTSMAQQNFRRARRTIAANSDGPAPAPPTQVRATCAGVMPAAAQAWRTDCWRIRGPGLRRRGTMLLGRRSGG